MINFLLKIRRYYNTHKTINKDLLNNYIDFIYDNYLYIDQYNDINIKEEIEYRKIRNIYTLRNFLNKKEIFDCFSGFSYIYPTNCKFKIDYVFGNTIYLYWNIFDNKYQKKILNYIKTTTCNNIIIDLRDNCGGNIMVAINLLNIFLENCELCTLQYRNIKTVYYSDSEIVKFNNIIIFLNCNTMSSAELFYYALYKNNNNVWLVGNQSYGKSVGQLKYISNMNKDICLSITSFKWSIQNQLITDFEMENSYKNRIINIDKNADKNKYMQVANNIVNKKSVL